eukprot:CFRG0283T1
MFSGKPFSKRFQGYPLKCDVRWVAKLRELRQEVETGSPFSECLGHIYDMMREGTSLKIQLQEIKNATAALFKGKQKHIASIGPSTHVLWGSLCEILVDMHLSTLSSALHLHILSLLNAIDKQTDCAELVATCLTEKTAAALEANDCTAMVADALASLLQTPNGTVARRCHARLHEVSVRILEAKIRSWNADDGIEIQTRQAIVQSFTHFISSTYETLYNTDKCESWTKACIGVVNACLLFISRPFCDTAVPFRLKMCELLCVTLSAACYRSNNELTRALDVIMNGHSSRVKETSLVMPHNMSAGICSPTSVQLAVTHPMIVLPIVAGILEKIPSDVLHSPSITQAQSNTNTVPFTSTSTPTPLFLGYLPVIVEISRNKSTMQRNTSETDKMVALGNPNRAIVRALAYHTVRLWSRKLIDMVKGLTEAKRDTETCNEGNILATCYSASDILVFSDVSKMLLPVVMKAFSDGASDSLVRPATDIFDDILSLQTYREHNCASISPSSASVSSERGLIGGSHLLQDVMTVLVDPKSYLLTKWTLLSRVLSVSNIPTNTVADTTSATTPAFDLYVFVPLLLRQAGQAVCVHPPTHMTNDVSQCLRALLKWIQSEPTSTRNSPNTLVDVQSISNSTTSPIGITDALSILADIAVRGELEVGKEEGEFIKMSFFNKFSTSALCANVESALGKHGYFLLLELILRQQQQYSSTKTMYKAEQTTCRGKTTLHIQAIITTLQYGLLNGLFHSADLFTPTSTSTPTPQTTSIYSPEFFFQTWGTLCNTLMSQALCAHDVYLRVLAFNLLADNPRPSEVCTEMELKYIKSFVKFNMNIPQSKARALICDALVKITRRMRLAFGVVVRGKQQAEAQARARLLPKKVTAASTADKRNSSDSRRRIAQAEKAKRTYAEDADNQMNECLQWLMQYIVTEVYPVGQGGGPFGHTSTVLGILSSLVETEIDEISNDSKRYEGNQKVKNDEDDAVDANNDQIIKNKMCVYYATLDMEWNMLAQKLLLPCLQDPLESHRQGAYTLLACLYRHTHTNTYPEVKHTRFHGEANTQVEPHRLNYATRVGANVSESTDLHHMDCNHTRQLLSQGSRLLSSPRAVEGEAGALHIRLCASYAENGFGCGCDVLACINIEDECALLGVHKHLHTDSHMNQNEPMSIDMRLEVGVDEQEVACKCLSHTIANESVSRLLCVRFEKDLQVFTHVDKDSCQTKYRLWTRLRFIQRLFLRLEGEVQVARQSLLLAAHDSPMYATFNAIRNVLLDTDWKKLNILTNGKTQTQANRHTNTSSSSETPPDTMLVDMWRDVLEACCFYSLELVHLVAPVVRNESPEGNLPEDVWLSYQRAIAVLKNNARNNGSACTRTHDYSHNVQGPLHKVVLVCSWLTVQSVSQLVKHLATDIAPTTGVDLTHGSEHLKSSTLVNVNMIQSLGDSFIDQLINTVHVGAFEQARPGFEALTRLCWSVGGEKKFEGGLQALPVRWGEAIFTAIASDSSNTRRSAGLPAVIMTLITHDPTKTYLNVVLPKLIALAQMPSETDRAVKSHIDDDARPTSDTTSSAIVDVDGFETISSSTPSLPQVHGLNILRTLCRDATIGARVMDSFESLLILAVTCFSSPHWHVRNAATMLYAALLYRIMGPENRPSHAAKAGVDAFFNAYPQTLRYFNDLLHGQAATRPAQLYPALTLLARFKPASETDTVDVAYDMNSATTPTPFTPPLKSTSSPTPTSAYVGHNQVFFTPVRAMTCSRNHMTRSMAAKALIALVRPNQVCDFIQDSCRSVCDSVFAQYISTDPSTSTFTSIPETAHTRSYAHVHANHIHGVLRQILAFGVYYLSPCAPAVWTMGTKGSLVEDVFATIMVQKISSTIDVDFTHTNQHLVLDVICALTKGCHDMSRLADPSSVIDQSMKGGVYALASAFMDIILLLCECRKYLVRMKTSHKENDTRVEKVLSSIEDLILTVSRKCRPVLSGHSSWRATRRAPVMFASYLTSTASVLLQSNIHGRGDRFLSELSDTVCSLLIYPEEQVALTALDFVVHNMTAYNLHGEGLCRPIWVCIASLALNNGQIKQYPPLVTYASLALNRLSTAVLGEVLHEASNSLTYDTIARMVYARSVVCGETCRCKAGQCHAWAYTYDKEGVLAVKSDRADMEDESPVLTDLMRCNNHRARECYLGLVGHITITLIQSHTPLMQAEACTQLDSMSAIEQYVLNMTKVLEIGSHADRSARARMAAMKSLRSYILSDSFEWTKINYPAIAARLLMIVAVLIDDDDEDVRKDAARLVQELDVICGLSTTVCLNLHPEVALVRILSHVEAIGAITGLPLLLRAMGQRNAANIIDHHIHKSHILSHTHTVDMYKNLRIFTQTPEDVPQTSIRGLGGEEAGDKVKGVHGGAVSIGEQRGTSALFVMEDANVYNDPIRSSWIIGQSLARVAQAIMAVGRDVPLSIITVALTIVTQDLHGLWMIRDVHTKEDTHSQTHIPHGWLMSDLTQQYCGWLAMLGLVSALNSQGYHRYGCPVCKNNMPHDTVTDKLSETLSEVMALLQSPAVTDVADMVRVVIVKTKDILNSCCQGDAVSTDGSESKLFSQFLPN